MYWDIQEDKNQEINNGVMAAGEDRYNPLSPAKGNINEETSCSLNSNRRSKVGHRHHANTGLMNCIFVCFTAGKGLKPLITFLMAFPEVEGEQRRLVVSYICINLERGGD